MKNEVDVCDNAIYQHHFAMSFLCSLDPPQTNSLIFNKEAAFHMDLVEIGKKESASAKNFNLILIGNCWCDIL